VLERLAENVAETVTLRWHMSVDACGCRVWYAQRTQSPLRAPRYFRETQHTWRKYGLSAAAGPGDASTQTPPTANSSKRDESFMGVFCPFLPGSMHARPPGLDARRAPATPG
jgi:hypothetical protein